MQAPEYNRTKNFAENNPDRTDHAALNSELDSVSQSINVLRDNAALIQKDDGSIKNSIIDLANLTDLAKEGLKVPGIQGQQGIQGVKGDTGAKGDKGDKGASFDADARDVFANRGLYNLQPKGFSMLAIDTGNMYFKLSDTSGDWSDGVQFGKGETGDQGLQGIQGLQGLQGLQGIQGVKGDKGDDGADGTDGAVITIDTATKTASLVGRTTVSARLVLSGGQLSIVLSTA